MTMGPTAPTKPHEEKILTIKRKDGSTYQKRQGNIHNRIDLPWTMDQAGMTKFVKDWKVCADGREFCNKHNLDQKQWLKCVAIAAHLRKAGVKIALLKFRRGMIDGLDIEMLKKIAEA